MKTTASGRFTPGYPEQETHKQNVSPSTQICPAPSVRWRCDLNRDKHKFKRNELSITLCHARSSENNFLAGKLVNTWLVNQDNNGKKRSNTSHTSDMISGQNIGVRMESVSDKMSSKHVKVKVICNRINLSTMVRSARSNMAKHFLEGVFVVW